MAVRMKKFDHNTFFLKKIPFNLKIYMVYFLQLNGDCHNALVFRKSID